MSAVAVGGRQLTRSRGTRDGTGGVAGQQRGGIFSGYRLRQPTVGFCCRCSTKITVNEQGEFGRRTPVVATASDE